MYLIVFEVLIELQCLLHVNIIKERYLRRHGKAFWISIEKRPHVLVLTAIVTTGAQVSLRGGQLSMTRPTKNDIEKMVKNEISFYEISNGVHFGSFRLIIN